MPREMAYSSAYVQVPCSRYREARFAARNPRVNPKQKRSLSMLDKAIIQQLCEIVGKDQVLTQKVDLVAYSYDATADVPRRTPDVVVTPTTIEQVQGIINLA